MPGTTELRHAVIATFKLFSERHSRTQKIHLKVPRGGGAHGREPDQTFPVYFYRETGVIAALPHRCTESPPPRSATTQVPAHRQPFTAYLPAPSARGRRRAPAAPLCFSAERYPWRGSAHGAAAAQPLTHPTSQQRPLEAAAAPFSALPQPSARPVRPGRYGERSARQGGHGAGATPCGLRRGVGAGRRRQAGLQEVLWRRCPWGAGEFHARVVLPRFFRQAGSHRSDADRALARAQPEGCSRVGERVDTAGGAARRRRPLPLTATEQACLEPSMRCWN